MSPLPFLGVSSLMNLAAPSGRGRFSLGAWPSAAEAESRPQKPRISSAVVLAPAQRSFEISRYSGDLAKAS
jgi:hypothetical protein